MNGYASQLCVCRYASQVVCMDTRPKLCVWIRVPTSCTDTRPKLTSRYASRMSYLLRYVTSVHARAHTMYTCIRVPSCVFGYASQVVCMDTRPKLCVWIRVPTSCTDTRSKLKSRYASRMSYLLRYVASVHARAHTMYPCIRVPSCVYGYASQVVCMDTRPKLCVWIRVPTLCMDTRPNCEFVLFLCEFYGFLWIFMISMVNSMVFPRILVEFYGFS